MSPPIVSSSFAVCLRCQFRYSHRLQLSRNPIRLPLRPSPAAFFTTASRAKANSHPPSEGIVILEPPAPRKSLHRYGPPPVKAEDLDEINLNSGIQQLLTFEYQGSVLDAAHMEILLYKPEDIRVSKGRYEQMSEDLDHAFLKPQLYEYYSRAMQSRGEKSRYCSKRQVLDGILRKCWGIEVTDEIAEREDVVRFKEIQSCRRDIFFMIGEDGRVLRRWAEKYSTRITVNVQTSALQLRGSLANIERIEAEIEGILKNLITEDIDLSWVLRLETFNEEFIPPIARITGTFIEKVDQNTIRVVALGPSRGAIDDTRRLLFTSLDLQLRSSYSMLYSALPFPGQGSKTGALYPFMEDPSLPWRFRGRDWTRWREVKRKPSPGQAESEPQNDSIHTMLKDEKNMARLNEVREVLDRGANLGALVPGEPHVHSVEYRVILGCLLHDSGGDQILKGPHLLEDFIKQQRPRVFSHDFPGVSFLAQIPHSRIKPSSDQLEPLADSVDYSFKLKFAPSPWSNPDTFEHFPPLEMIVSVDPHSGEAQDPKLVAIHSESVADFLMPSRNCDLRFLRRHNVPLGLGTGESELATGGITEQEMKRFINECNLNPTGNDRLRASPYIKVSIPPWMIKSSLSSPTEEIDYIYTGMEFRHELQFDWEGHRLHHTIVEGGISGGRNTEVKLVCNAATSAKNHDEKKKKARDFERLEADREAEEAESGPGTSESEALSLGMQDPVNPISVEPLIEVSDISFSSFVGSTMRLVKALEKRLSDSVREGRGVLR